MKSRQGVKSAFANALGKQCAKVPNDITTSNQDVFGPLDQTHSKAFTFFEIPLGWDVRRSNPALAKIAILDGGVGQWVFDGNPPQWHAYHLTTETCIKATNPDGSPAPDNWGRSDSLLQSGDEGTVSTVNSDQGSTYTAHGYRQLIRDSGGRASFSAPGKPQENAYAESFFRTLKLEEVVRNRYESFLEVEDSIDHFMNQIYNQARMHSSLEYMSPDQFEAQHTGDAL